MDNKPVDEAIYSKHNNRFSIEFPLRAAKPINLYFAHKIQHSFIIEK